MRDFLPEIRQVFSVSSNHEPCEWDVQTDRGRVKFVLKNDEDVRRVDANARSLPMRTTFSIWSATLRKWTPHRDVISNGIFK